jgi:hypothetical protein
LKGKPYEEVVFLTDREATEAERSFHRRGDNMHPNGALHLQSYAASLKDFLVFVRHGVMTSIIRNSGLKGLQSFRNNLLH